MDRNESFLDSLGMSFGTDKCSWGHDYLRFYEPFLINLRGKNITLLEIGVAGGASLRVWEQYFPQGRIIGGDIEPSCKRFAAGRTEIEIFDQSDKAQLLAVAEKYGPFDVIIDDGSHMWAHQILTFKTLFSYLKDEGVFIVEDLQTNFGEFGKRYRGQSDISFMDYAKKLVDVKVACGQLSATDVEDDFISFCGTKLKTINFYRECAVFQNGYQVTTDELISPRDGKDHERENIAIMAHIGGYGDKRSGNSVIRGRGQAQNIQGFAIYSSKLKTLELEYRVKSQEGNWTPWFPHGEFAGSRGESKDLTGFSVRLVGDGAREYEVEAIGLFRDSSHMVVAATGTDCVSQSGDAPLWGMQISLLRARS